MCANNNDTNLMPASSERGMDFLENSQSSGEYHDSFSEIHSIDVPSTNPNGVLFWLCRISLGRGSRLRYLSRARSRLVDLGDNLENNMRALRVVLVPLGFHLGSCQKSGGATCGHRLHSRFPRSRHANTSVSATARANQKQSLAR